MDTCEIQQQMFENSEIYNINYSAPIALRCQLFKLNKYFGGSSRHGNAEKLYQICQSK